MSKRAELRRNWKSFIKERSYAKHTTFQEYMWNVLGLDFKSGRYAKE
jgi:hypothetical protein